MLSAPEKQLFCAVHYSAVQYSTVQNSTVTGPRRITRWGLGQFYK